MLPFHTKKFEPPYGTVAIPVQTEGRVARNRNVLQDGYNPYYPKQPTISESCGVNVVYRTLPPFNEPTPETGGETYWQTNLVGPTTMKSIYTGIPNYYPYMRSTTPVDTLYGHDYSLFHTSGVGKGKRMGYQAKMFPFTDRNVREYREYAEEIIPAPSLMSHVKHPVYRDTTINSPLQVLPQAYMP